jgi:hypothetical protein
MQERALASLLRWMVLSLPAERGNHENANRSSRKDDTALRFSQIARRDGVPSNPNQHKASGAWLAFKGGRGVNQFRLICSPLFRRLPLWYVSPKDGRACIRLYQPRRCGCCAISPSMPRSSRRYDDWGYTGVSYSVALATEKGTLSEVCIDALQRSVAIS